MEDEIWLPVPSKPEIMASSFGRVMLPPREAPMPHGGMRNYTPKPTYGNIAKASKTARHTHRALFNRFFGNMKVHRLVCEAFHGPAPKGMQYVLHLDEDAHNNRPENLRWGTQKENMNMPKFIEYCKGRTGDESPFVKGRKAKHGEADNPGNPGRND